MCELKNFDFILILPSFLLPEIDFDYMLQFLYLHDHLNGFQQLLNDLKTIVWVSKNLGKLFTLV